MFALRMLIEKYREGQKELNCVFVALKKAYDRVLREDTLIDEVRQESLWTMMFQVEEDP